MGGFDCVFAMLPLGGFLALGVSSKSSLLLSSSLPLLELDPVSTRFLFFSLEPQACEVDRPVATFLGPSTMTCSVERREINGFGLEQSASQSNCHSSLQKNKPSSSCYILQKRIIGGDEPQACKTALNCRSEIPLRCVDTAEQRFIESFYLLHAKTLLVFFPSR